MGSLVGKLHPGKFYVVQCHTQAGNITNNIKVKVYFNLPALSAKNFLMSKYHVDDSVKGRYDIIIGQYILTELGLNLILYEHVIEKYDGPFKGYAYMVDLGTYIF